MPSDKRCCVPGCLEPQEGRKTVLHGFPNPINDKPRFNAWIYAVGGSVMTLEIERICKYRRVCHSHFEPKYYCYKDRLSKDAVPTLNMPDFKTKMESSPFEKRKPMKNVLNLSVPSTSKDENSQNPLLESVLSTAAVPDNIAMKENIDARKNTQSSEIEKQKPMKNVSNLSAMFTSQDQEAMIPEEEPAQAKPADIGTKRKISLQTKLKKTRRLYLTKKEIELHSKIVAAKIKICKMQKRIKKQLAEIKTAKKIASDPAALQIFENCSSTARLLMQIQCRENKKKDKGRRFTLQEKLVALSILKQSPKGYRFLRKNFILPAPQTLIKLIQNSNIQPGINQNIFSQLKKKTATMTTTQRLCVLLFDEVSIKPNVSYNQRKDMITGFVDNGCERKSEFADHAQVFMIRGLINNYKQPVSYTFASSATKGPELARQIKDVVSGLQNAGLIVVATVCDQGSNNRNAINILLNETKGVFLRRGEEAKNNVILINDQEIVPLYDPPHLLKGLRNNLMTKDLKYEQDGVIKTAKWSHLQALLKENPGYKGIRIIPKLTENHVNPEKNKMKVKYAAQIFSSTVASNMGYLAHKKILPIECEETADFLLVVDKMFDSVNGSHKKNNNAKPLLGPVKPGSIHFETWHKCKRILKSMKFKRSCGKDEVVPSITNWLWTLDGIEVLLKSLQKKFNVTSVWLRHLNQDPLENFFGSIRSHGCRNTNPTCEQFESAFTTLLVNSLNSVHTRGKNCEGDYCDALHALIIDNKTEPSVPVSVEYDHILDAEIIPLEEKEKDPLKLAPLQYMSGYFLKTVKSKVFKACPKCTENLSSQDEIEYIHYREYEGKRWLCYPSQELVRCISNIHDVTNHILKNKLDKRILLEQIQTAVMVLINFDFVKCHQHKNKVIKYLIKSVVICLMYNNCRILNKILTGRKEVEDGEDKFQVQAKRVFTKCFKRKINKLL